MATAPPSKVMVTTQEVFDADVPSNVGRSLWIGITKVWLRDTPRPPKQSATTVRTGLRRTADDTGAFMLCMLHA